MKTRDLIFLVMYTFELHTFLQINVKNNFKLLIYNLAERQMWWHMTHGKWQVEGG